jgi:hypothetical protein
MPITQIDIDEATNVIEELLGEDAERSVDRLSAAGVLYPRSPGPILHLRGGSWSHVDHDPPHWVGARVGGPCPRVRLAGDPYCTTTWPTMPIPAWRRQTYE